MAVYDCLNYLYLVIGTVCSLLSVSDILIHKIIPMLFII